MSFMFVMRLFVSVSFCLPTTGFLVETMQSNPHLLMESGGAVPHHCQEGTVSETSIPVPILNWQASQPPPESVYLLAMSAVFVSRSTSPVCSLYPSV